MSDRHIIALIIPTDTNPYLQMIPATLATYQPLVGGYIQHVRMGTDAVLFCNEDGKNLGLPVNRLANTLVPAAGPCLLPGDFLVGQVVAVGLVDPHTGKPTDDEQHIPAHLLDLCDTLGVQVDCRPGEHAEGPHSPSGNPAN